MLIVSLFFTDPYILKISLAQDIHHIIENLFKEYYIFVPEILEDGVQNVQRLESPTMAICKLDSQGSQFQLGPGSWRTQESER